jgi:hypothetical protein
MLAGTASAEVLSGNQAIRWIGFLSEVGTCPAEVSEAPHRRLWEADPKIVRFCALMMTRTPREGGDA